MTASPHWGQTNWVAPGLGTARPHEVHRRSVVDCMGSADRAYFFEAPRRRAPTRAPNIKSAPKNATAPVTYQSV